MYVCMSIIIYIYIYNISILYIYICIYIYIYTQNRKWTAFPPDVSDAGEHRCTRQDRGVRAYEKDESTASWEVRRFWCWWMICW